MGMREEAEKILKKAYAVASYNPESTCTHEELIDYVIDNTHLTYKYVLFTALLSKATALVLLSSGNRAGLFKKGSLEPPIAFFKTSISKGTITL